MEQNNQPTQPSPNQGGKVMDVQPPGGQMPGTGDVKLTPPNTTQANTENAPTSTPEQPRPPASNQQLPPASSEPSQPEQPKQVADKSKNHNKKPKGPILVVVPAVIVLLSLCGLAVFLYLQGGQDSISNTETPQTSTQPAEGELPADTTTPEQATDQAAEAVDQTLKDIDESSGTDQNEISDGTLGL